jgi:outer membrane cobalamin receptor
MDGARSSRLMAARGCLAIGGVIRILTYRSDPNFSGKSVSAPAETVE